MTTKHVDSEQRICFGIKWFLTEQDAQRYHDQIKAMGKCYNGGWFDGMPCGRNESFDRVVDGVKQYAVTD